MPKGVAIMVRVIRPILRSVIRPLGDASHSTHWQCDSVSIVKKTRTVPQQLYYLFREP